MKLAGHLIQYEGLPSETIVPQTPIGDERECFCGSGKRYKDCCKLVDHYFERDENINCEI